MKHEENVTYQLIPDGSHEQDWNMRLLEGPYNETVVKIGAVAVNEKKGHLTFNFTVIESPDEELNEDNIELQDYVADILQHVIVEAIKTGDIEMRERTEGTLIQ